MLKEKRPVEVGDLYLDNDPRHRERIVRIIREERRWERDGFIVENVEHWNEKMLGRRTWVSALRLSSHGGRLTGYTKVSH